VKRSNCAKQHERFTAPHELSPACRDATSTSTNTHTHCTLDTLATVCWTCNKSLIKYVLHVGIPVKKPLVKMQ